MLVDPTYPLLAVMVVSLVLVQVNQRLASPSLAILNRWLRWLIFSFGTAVVIQEFQVVDRPFWVLVALCCVVWFLLETLYNWLAISALSQSPMPLFPNYVINPGGDEWPVQKRMTLVRDQLRAEGYKHLQALRAEMAPGIFLRVSVYEHPKTSLRLQIMFMPQPSGAVCMSVVATSLSTSGHRLVTDNLHIPFGGFYPENWHVLRSPWTRSVEKLIRLHQKRVRQFGEDMVLIQNSPLSDIEQSQRELDHYNTDMGFLFGNSDREEFGKITHHGRYRVWKEIWMLDYFGRSFRY